MDSEVAEGNFRGALVYAEQLFFGRLFPDQKRKAFTLLCNVAAAARQFSDEAASLRSQIEALGDTWGPLVDDDLLEALKSEMQSWESEPVADASAPKEEAGCEPEPEPEPEPEAAETLSEADLLEALRSFDVLIQAISTLRDSPDARAAALRELGTLAAIESNENRIWAVSETHSGFNLGIGARSDSQQADLLRELPVGARIALLQITPEQSFVIPCDESGWDAAFDELCSNMTQMRDEVAQALDEMRAADPACSSCGASLLEDARFCHSCGAPRFAAATSTVSMSPAAPIVEVPAPVCEEEQAPVESIKLPVAQPPASDIDHGPFIEKADGGFHLKQTDDASIRAYIQYLRTARPNWTEIALGGSGRVLVYAASVAMGYDWALSPETKANVIESLRRDEDLTREFPTLANLVGVPIAPAKPGITLTAKEKEHLLWEPEDWYEIVPGNLTFTSSRMFALSVHGKNEHVMKTFFFDPNPPSDWDSQEWSFASPADLPNGPSLLVLLRRGNRAEVFGVVSMVNRAWAHVLPLLASGMIENSSRIKTLQKQAFKSVAKNVAKASPWMLVPVVGSFIAQSKAASAPSESRETIEELAATARLLMHRIASTADKYWSDGQGASSGRL